MSQTKEEREIIFLEGDRVGLLNIICLGDIFAA